MILFWYVFRELIKYVLVTLVLCVFLFLLFDFMHKTTRYIPRYNPSSDLLIKAYFYQIPGLLLQAIPIASLLGSVVCMVLLSRTNEITAMRAAGIGPFQLGLPVFSCGLLLCGLCVFLGEIVIPGSSKKVHYIQEVLIERGSDVESADSYRWMKTDSGFFNFKEYDPVTSMLTGVRLIELGEGFRPKKTVNARLATYRKGFDDWVLEDVRISYFWPKGALSYSDVKDVLTIKLPFEPSRIVKERRLASEFSSRELFDSIGRGSVAGFDVTSFKVELFHKTAFYFAPLIVCLISLKFGYKSERVMETAKSILVAIAIGMSYWFIASASRALGSRGIIPPFISGWIANFAVIFITLLHIVNDQKD